MVIRLNSEEFSYFYTVRKTEGRAT
jgi:hypothetical protein